MSPEEKKKKDLGIYYTDERIVSFIFDILLLWKEKEDKERYRWHFPSGQRKYPSIIDPACGEGTFLKMALDKGFTGKHPQSEAPYIFGIDIDERAFQNWSKITLSSYFPDEETMRKHFRKQNGLIPLPKDIKLRYKRGGLREFDCAVGNPPYGGVGLQEIDEELEDTLIKYKIWRKSFSKEKQLSLLAETLGRKNIEQLKKFPIEILFIDRFIQLTKLGGYIAIILPDGIFANSNLHYVRQFITDNTRVEAIISLPRGAFKNVGTSAKTSILFLRKPRKDKLHPHLSPPPTGRIKDVSSPPPLRGRMEEGGGGNNLNYNVFLGAVNNTDDLKQLFKFYKEVFEMNSIKEKVKVIKDAQGNEAVMVRVDKTMKELMEEKPCSRWSPLYWHPQFTIIEDAYKTIKWETKNIGSFNPFITYGPIVVNKKFESQVEGMIIINQPEIMFTGLGLTNAGKAKEDSPWVVDRAMPREGDLLLARSGVGGIGKNKITIFNKPIRACVSCFVDILRLKDISPYYVLLFWKGIYGWSQINRIINGVGTVNISFDEIRSIKIPILPEKIQANIESEYKKMSVYHDRAMEAKAKNDEANYKKNIEIAEKMLKDLISKTEAVIRGERKDVL